MGRQHHVGAVHRMNQIRGDAVYLLLHGDLPFFIDLIQEQRTIRGDKAHFLRCAALMKYEQPYRSDPHHAAIGPGENVGELLQPFHDVARLNRDFANALL